LNKIVVAAVYRDLKCSYTRPVCTANIHQCWKAGNGIFVPWQTEWI